MGALETMLLLVMVHPTLAVAAVALVVDLVVPRHHVVVQEL
jgi:hypothetical protein